MRCKPRSLAPLWDKHTMVRAPSMSLSFYSAARNRPDALDHLMIGNVGTRVRLHNVTTGARSKPKLTAPPNFLRASWNAPHGK